MGNQLDVFLPYFESMVKDRGLTVTPEQQRGVELLLENMVTSDQAAQVETMLHLAPGSSSMYVDLLLYIESLGNNSVEGTEPIELGDTGAQYANLWNALATILSMSAPTSGAKFEIVPLDVEE